MFFNDELWADLVEDALPNITRTANNVDAITAYTNVIKLNNVVSNSVYLKTNPINDRRLESLPIFNIYHSDKLNEDFLFNGYLLYNQTSEQLFTASNPNLGAYLLLSTDDLINKLDSEIVRIQLPPILELFQNAKVQERRLGLLFQLFKNYGRWSIEATLPLIYQERNFFFSDSEQSIINLEFSKVTGSTSSKINQDYFKQHAVSDQIGFGDVKIKAGCRLFSSEQLKLKIGTIVTIPSSFSLKKGLIGSDFRKTLAVPTIDLRQVYNWISEIKNDINVEQNSSDFTAFGTDFLLKALHRLDAIVLDQSLGNRHHFALGGFYDAKIILNANVACIATGELLYAIPKKELRFFNQRKNPADFTTAALYDEVNALSGADQEALAKIKVDFLNTNAVTSMFPTAAWATVKPRANLQFSIGPQFEIGAYLLHFGYNYWHSCQEQIGTISLIDPALYPLNITDAVSPAATQHKIFVHFDYSKITPQHIWKIAICGDQTINATGIGKDFNFALELSVDF